MTARPGEPAGDCPRCDGDRVQVGYGNAVIGAYCDRCDLTVVLVGDAMSFHDARDRDFEDFELPPKHSVGPDPNP